MSTSPQEISQSNYMVVFTDLSGFTRAIKGMDEEEVFKTMVAYFEYLGEVAEEGGGTLIKCMGDAGLVVFPESCVDSGAKAILRLRQEGDQWLTDHGLRCRHCIKAHFGQVFTGPMGAKGSKCFNVYGQTVMVAATIKSSGLALTAQAFRQLSRETRTLFKKHTPPISYIPVDERH